MRHLWYRACGREDVVPMSLEGGGEGGADAAGGAARDEDGAHDYGTVAIRQGKGSMCRAALRSLDRGESVNVKNDVV